MEGEPVDRFLARRTRLPWAEVRRAIQRGRVTLDGARLGHYHRPLRAGSAVALDGCVVPDGPDDAVLICHKPMGLACGRAIEHAPLLYQLVPAGLAHPDLQTAGQLDRDTTGLIILTIDGALIHRLTDPEQALWKRYRVRWTGALAADATERVAAGLSIADDDEPCLPARLLEVEATADGGSGTLELCEGRNHQVKRMIRALGGEVVALHRDRIGALALPADLAPGTMRPITPEEFACLPAPRSRQPRTRRG